MLGAEVGMHLGSGIVTHVDQASEAKVSLSSKLTPPSTPASSSDFVGPSAVVPRPLIRQPTLASLRRGVQTGVVGLNAGVNKVCRGTCHRFANLNQPFVVRLSFKALKISRC